MSNDLKEFRGGCMLCPSSEDILAMNEVLYNGFGGYSVYKNNKLYYSGDPQGEWNSFKTLKDIEKVAKKEKGSWKVVLDSPLRGATWRRNEVGQWILKETNQGFA